MDLQNENGAHYHHNNTNGVVTIDFKENKEENHSRIDYFIELDKVVNQMKRYCCTCPSSKGRCKAHGTNQIKPTQKQTVPLHRSNGRTNMDTTNKQEIARAKKAQKVNELREIEKQKKREMERENYQRWLMEKAKQKEEKIKMEEQQLKKKREVEEMKKLKKAEGELRYKLWLKEKEVDYLCKYQVTCPSTRNKTY